MKKVKKVLLLITIFSVVLSVIFTIKTDGYYIFKAGLYIYAELGLYATDYFVKDFKENQRDFELIANIIIDSVDSDADSRFVYFIPDRDFSSGDRIFIVKKDDFSPDSEVRLLSEETEAFNRIRECFRVEEANFHSLSFDREEKMVYFHTSDGRYSLVYSEGNKKPYYVNGTYESEYGQEYVVDKICKNWFNIALK